MNFLKMNFPWNSQFLGDIFYDMCWICLLLSLLSTLEYLIAEHARLTILNIFSTLLALNRSCSLNYFEDFIHPAHLLDPANFIFQGNLQF